MRFARSVIEQLPLLGLQRLIDLGLVNVGLVVEMLLGAPQIVAALAEKGISIEEKHVGLEHPIKELGIYNVAIALDAENSAEIAVWIVEPGE